MPPAAEAELLRGGRATAGSTRTRSTRCSTLPGTACGERPRELPAGLTERELEVLLVLVRGESNQEIADDLGISAKTVGHHVQHVYEKAGVRSRAAATLWAFEHDLVRSRDRAFARCGAGGRAQTRLAHRRRAAAPSNARRRTVILATTTGRGLRPLREDLLDQGRREAQAARVQGRAPSSAIPTRTTASGCSSTGTRRAGRASSPTPRSRRSCRRPGTRAGRRPAELGGRTTPSVAGAGLPVAAPAGPHARLVDWRVPRVRTSALHDPRRVRPRPRRRRCAGSARRATTASSSSTCTATTREQVRAWLDERGLVAAGRHARLDVLEDELAALAEELARARHRPCRDQLDRSRRARASGRGGASGSPARRARRCGSRPSPRVPQPLERARARSTAAVRSSTSCARCRAELLWLELDLGWIWQAGADPVEELERTSGRCPLVHVKDYASREGARRRAGRRRCRRLRPRAAGGGRGRRRVADRRGGRGRRRPVRRGRALARRRSANRRRHDARRCASASSAAAIIARATSRTRLRSSTGSRSRAPTSTPSCAERVRRASTACGALSVDALIADPEIELVLNLTPPRRTLPLVARCARRGQARLHREAARAPAPTKRSELVAAGGAARPAPRLRAGHVPRQRLRGGAGG